MNYLIFRYLQEAGHENTATAFHHDWHRTAEYRDPENYPFAPVVRRNELISVIQRGLHHDDLEARTKKNQARFTFTRVTSRVDFGDRPRDAEAVENGAAPPGSAAGAASRPASAAKRKARPSLAHIPQQDFPTPPPKRQRRSEGSEGVHLNGDAMEVDAASPSAADADEDGDAVSPIAASEPEMTEIPERYDSMDVAVQTEIKTGPKTSTMYWKVDMPQSTIYHSAFNPSAGSGNANTLMTVGELLCRFYQVPENAENAQQVSIVDEPSLPLNSVVTASAWHPNGHVVALAADTIGDEADSEQSAQQLVFAHDCSAGTSLDHIDALLLEPQGIALALRYSPNGSRLAVLRTNLKGGSITIYDTSNSDDAQVEAIAWSVSEQPALDVAWIDPATYIAVGENGLVETSHLATNHSSQDESLQVEGKKSAGISAIVAQRLPEDEQSRTFDKVRYAPWCDTTVLVSDQSRRLVICHRGNSSSPELHFVTSVDLDDQLTAIAFQPIMVTTKKHTGILATTFEDGSCVLHSCTPPVDKPTETTTSEQVQKLFTLYLEASPALALAWSLDGAYLAVAGMDLVQVWKIETLIARDPERVEKKHGATHKALVTWRPDSNAAGRRNGEHDEPARALSEPSLSWSADGESLAFAVDREVSLSHWLSR